MCCASAGRLGARQYFECPRAHGGFYRVDDVNFEPEVRTDDADAARTARLRDPALPPEDAGDSSGTTSAGAACASTSVAAGRGLHTAVVKHVAQFVVTAHDALGRRCKAGRDVSSPARANRVLERRAHLQRSSRSGVTSPDGG